MSGGKKTPPNHVPEQTSGALVRQDQKLESGEGGLAQSAERKSGGERTSSQSRMINGRDNFVDKHRSRLFTAKAMIRAHRLVYRKSLPWMS